MSAPARLARLGFLLALTGAVVTGAPPTSAKKVTESPGLMGCDPAALRARLALLDSMDVSRACGNMFAPWAYRGSSGRHMVMRSYGHHHADSAHARAVADLLVLGRTIDTTARYPTRAVACEPAAGRPVYLVGFHARERATFAVLNFDYGTAVFFDAETPLGMVGMGAGGDSLWAALGDVVEDDPLLRAPRPQPYPADSIRSGAVDIDKLPEMVYRVHPAYPMEARQSRVSGKVMLLVKVGVEGAVRDAIVLSGPSLLRDAALAAVWQWHFNPALDEGKPVEVWVNVPFNFTPP
jgi:TonB family protein